MASILWHGLPLAYRGRPLSQSKVVASDATGRTLPHEREDFMSLDAPAWGGHSPRMTKLALITGASRGLGAALAEALAETHHVVAVARTVGGLEELDDRIQVQGGSATLAPLDVTDAGAVRGQHFFADASNRQHEA